MSQEDIAKKYLQLCEEGKTLSEIAKEFKVSEDEFKKWPKNSRKAKLGAVWELGLTYFKAYHEALYKEMVRNKKDYSSQQITGQKEFLTVYVKEWNIKKETKVTVTNKWEGMSEKDIEKELQSTLKRKNNKALIIDILGLHSDTERSSPKPH